MKLIALSTPLACLLMAGMAALYPVGRLQAQALPEGSCHNLTMFNCAKRVRDTLTANSVALADDPQRAIRIAAEWDTVYRKAYLGLKGQPRSESDLNKLRDAIVEKINPVEIAKEKALDALVKRYLPRLAPVMAFLSTAPMTAVTTFLTPSEVASDLDELEAANKAVHEALWPIVTSKAQPDWRQRLAIALQQVQPPGPVIRQH